MNRFSSNSIRLTLAALALLSLNACDSDPSSEDDDHPEADLVRIQSAGIVIVNASESTAFAPVLVARGVSLDLEVVFTDEDGVPVTHGSDEFLDFQIGDESLARWEADSEGSFTGMLTGLSVGTTGIRLRLMHGDVEDDDAHSDFTSAEITLNVVE